VWADSQSRIWVSEWRSGQVSRYDPTTRQWRAWKAPGNDPQIYAVYVDNKDIVWLSDFGANATLRFDPKSEQFTVIKSKSRNASVRQILGRPGEVWLPESGGDKLVVIRE
jgi:virginiamycin B lyase